VSPFTTREMTITITTMTSANLDNLNFRKPTRIDRTSSDLHNLVGSSLGRPFVSDTLFDSAHLLLTYYRKMRVSHVTGVSRVLTSFLLYEHLFNLSEQHLQSFKIVSALFVCLLWHRERGTCSPRVEVAWTTGCRTLLMGGFVILGEGGTNHKIYFFTDFQYNMICDS
jgi:hypothetical protein